MDGVEKTVTISLIKEIQTAIDENNREFFESLISKDVDMNELLNGLDIRSCMSPLHYCIETKHTDMFSFMVDNSPELISINEDLHGDTILHYACRYDVLELTKALVDGKYERFGSRMINTQGKMKQTPIFHAVFNRNVELIQILLKASAKITVQDENGLTVLDYLLKSTNANEEIGDKANEEINKQAENANVQIIDQFLQHDRISFLKMCIEYFTSNRADSFIKNVITTNMSKLNPEEILSVLCLCADLDQSFLSLLNVSQVNDKGRTALHLASIRRNHDGVRTLLRCNINPNVTDDSGWTPFHYAIYYANSNMMDIMLQNGADKDFVDQNQNTYLHHCVKSNNEAATTFLIESGCSHFCMCNNNGLAPIHVAITKHSFNMLKYLINEDTINLRTSNAGTLRKMTPLHVAVNCSTTVNIIRLLLKQGADVHAMDCDGKTAVELCLNDHNDSLIEEKLYLVPRLIMAGSQLRHIDGESSLAVFNTFENFANLLLQTGCRISFRDQAQTNCECMQAITSSQQQPLSLLNHAANVVRASVRPNLISGLACIPLPKTLKDYLCFSHLNVIMDSLRYENYFQYYHNDP